jgi:predicted nucleotidyltransferase
MVTQKTIYEATDRLVQAYKPLEIYLFGSYAWGKPTEESDLDLLIIVENSEEKKYKRAITGHKALHGLMLSKDILVLTKDEFLTQIGDTTSLIYKIKTEGKKIYAKA